MNHYLLLTVREKSTGDEGIVISIDEAQGRLEVQFPLDVRWLQEDEIEITEE